MRNEVADAALVVELDRLALGALVDEANEEPLGEKCRLPQTLRESVRVHVELLEDLGVRQEADRGAGRLVRLAGELHGPELVAALELLAVELPVPPDLGDEPLGERVHDRGADAVEAAGDLVAVAAELAAGVELREDRRQGRLVGAGHRVDRHAAAPIADRDRVVGVEGHLDAVVVPGERLVHAVVDNFIDQVVEAPDAGRADVHARTQTDGLEALEHGDVFCGVGRFGHEKRPANSAFAA